MPWELPLRLTVPSWKMLCWLRPENDARHINLAELDVTLKRVNLALQWQARMLHIVTDSVCTHRWITDTLIGQARLTTKASSEMLIWRQLAMLAKTIKEYNLVVDIALIRLATNEADALTRVPQQWVTSARKGSELLQQPCAPLYTVWILSGSWVFTDSVSILESNRCSTSLEWSTLL